MAIPSAEIKIKGEFSDNEAKNPDTRNSVSGFLIKVGNGFKAGIHA